MSYEEQSKEPAGRRSPTRMFILYLLAGVALVIAALSLYVTQPLVGAARNPRPLPADPKRLEAHVRMLSEALGPRDASHPENLERCAAYIRREFEAANVAVSDQPFEADGETYRNVVARLGPETKERVVVGAHYDSAGPLPGADDNASGVAGLLELARLLAGADLAVRVELVAYALEEPPFFRTDLMGSAAHAGALRREGASVRAMFSLEMIGYFSDAADSQHFPAPGLSLLYPSEGNFISVVGRVGEGLLVRRIKRAMAGATSLPVYSISAPRAIPGVDFSDHLNYWREGYPAVMITDTAFYRNPNYHTAADTAEKLDYGRMAQVVEGACAAVTELAR